jgi:hypothetical protein
LRYATAAVCVSEQWIEDTYYHSYKLYTNKPAIDLCWYLIDNVVQPPILPSTSAKPVINPAPPLPSLHLSRIVLYLHLRSSRTFYALGEPYFQRGPSNTFKVRKPLPFLLTGVTTRNPFMALKPSRWLTKLHVGFRRSLSGPISDLVEKCPGVSMGYMYDVRSAQHSGRGAGRAGFDPSFKHRLSYLIVKSNPIM